MELRPDLRAVLAAKRVPPGARLHSLAPPYVQPLRVVGPQLNILLALSSRADMFSTATGIRTRGVSFVQLENGLSP